MRRFSVARCAHGVTQPEIFEVVNEIFEKCAFFIEIFENRTQGYPMIPFDEIDARLKSLGKSRVWLAEASGRKLRSIGDALAPAASDSKRSPLLQRALSDAIRDEEERQNAAQSTTLPPAQDRISIRCDMEQREGWELAAENSGMGVTRWAVKVLDDAAHAALGHAPAREKPNGTNG